MTDNTEQAIRGGIWINCAERLPKKPEYYPYSYNDLNEPQIIFVNTVHDCCFVWFLSMGWDISKHPDLNSTTPGWSLDQWKWLDESTTEIAQLKKEIGAYRLALEKIEINPIQRRMREIARDTLSQYPSPKQQDNEK